MLDKDGLISEVSIGVTYASLMSAVSLFFTGVLISQYQSFSPTIKVPLIFLIVSTFSFIFTATIYSNAGVEITLNKLRIAEKYMVYAKNIMEILGLYLFILATPLVIGAVTEDSFLRTTTITVALVGFTLYSQSKFSVLEKELAIHRKHALSAAVVLLALSLYLSQTLAPIFLYSSIAITLMGLLVISTVYFCLRSKQYKPSFFREFRDYDADVLSTVMYKNLDRVKGKHYPDGFIKSLRAQAEPAAIRALAKKKRVFVAEFNNKVVGLAALDDNRISSVFTDPSLHRKGIGRMLVDHLETVAAELGHDHTEVSASASDYAFYKKLGYQDMEETSTEASGKRVIMRKELPSA